MFEKLKLFIIENDRINREHYYQYHPSGRNKCENTEKHFIAVSAGELAFKLQAVIKGEINIDKVLSEIPSKIGEDLKDILKLRKEIREQFLMAVTDEIATQRETMEKSFASEQVNELLKMGYSKYRARQILNAAGSQYCIEAANWAKKLLEESKDIDLITVIVRGLNITQLGKERIEALLKKLGLPIPSVSTAEELRKLIAGVKEAL